MSENGTTSENGPGATDGISAGAGASAGAVSGPAGGGGGGGSVRERVFAAAGRISVERRPTVSTVRAAAGVSNADATRFLREWSEEQVAASRAVAAAPPALLEQAARLAGAYWAEASALAAERHAGIEAAWMRERAEKDTEIGELAADLDHATGERDTLTTEFEARIHGLEEQVTARDEEVRRVRAETDAAVQAAAVSERELITLRAQAATLQSAYEGLLRRITPPAPETAAEGTEEPRR